MIAEGVEEGDYAVSLSEEDEEDLGLAVRVVRLDVARLGDDLEGAVAPPVDVGRDAAGDVVAVVVGADADAGVCVVVDVTFW